MSLSVVILFLGAKWARGVLLHVSAASSGHTYKHPYEVTWAYVITGRTVNNQLSIIPSAYRTSPLFHGFGAYSRPRKIMNVMQVQYSTVQSRRTQTSVRIKSSSFRYLRVFSLPGPVQMNTTRTQIYRKALHPELVAMQESRNAHAMNLLKARVVSARAVTAETRYACMCARVCMCAP